MQIFLIDYSPIETAKILDPRRLNKQILECSWILNSYKTGQRPIHHPIAKMYKDHLLWVEGYMNVLKSYKNGYTLTAEIINTECMNITPPFLNQQYFDNFKKRLYTKDPEYYKQFKKYGTTEENWYYVEGTWYIYNGGRIGELELIDGKLVPKYY